MTATQLRPARQGGAWQGGARQGGAWQGGAWRTERFVAWACWLLLAVVYMLVARLVLATPMVSKRWPDGRCVAVTPARWSCDNLPRRYNVQWVGSGEMDGRR